MRIGTKKYDDDDNRFKQLLTLASGEKRFGIWLTTTKTFRGANTYRGKHKDEWARIVIGESVRIGVHPDGYLIELHNDIPFEQKEWDVYGIPIGNPTKGYRLQEYNNNIEKVN